MPVSYLCKVQIYKVKLSIYIHVYINIYIDEHEFNRRTYRLGANYLDGKCLPNLNKYSISPNIKVEN